MENANIPFADTTARRAHLMAVTEEHRTTITKTVDTMKGDAEETGKALAVVAVAAVGVFLLANALLPRSDEYRYAEQYGEPEDDDNQDRVRPSVTQQVLGQQNDRRSDGLNLWAVLGGALTPVLTNLARQQLSQFVTRLTNHDATEPRPVSGNNVSSAQ